MGRYSKQPLPAVELLDTILLNYDHIEAANKTNLAFIHRIGELSLSYYITLESVDSALDKLVHEGYMVSSPYTEQGLFGMVDTFTYKITWEGRYFIESGGYRGRIYREANEKRRIENLEQRTQKSNDDIVKLTRILVGATVIAAAYYLIEIGTWILSLFSPTKHLP